MRTEGSRGSAEDPADRRAAEVPDRARKGVAERIRASARRRAERRRDRLELDFRAARPRFEHIGRERLASLLERMPKWSFDRYSKTLENSSRTTFEVSAEALEELIDAVSEERSRGPLRLRVRGLSQAQAARVRGYLGEGSELFVPGSERPSRPIA